MYRYITRSWCKCPKQICTRYDRCSASLATLARAAQQAACLADRQKVLSRAVKEDSVLPGTLQTA